MAIKIAGTEVINDDKELVLAKLAEINASKAYTAVDVFVYDTSKDSDGGAWRNRTQHTSWYNETLNTATRGSRREFPSVAVIVIDSGNNATASIYDGDDPSLPLWGKLGGLIPRYSATNSTSVSAKNGKICLAFDAGYGGLATYSLIDALFEWIGFGQGGSSEGVYTVPNWKTSDVTPVDVSNATLIIGNPLVNRFINDIAMTVLPNAPIDPTTQLPIPTIAVATDGGVSVIKDDGSVVDITTVIQANTAAFFVDFDGNGGIIRGGYSTGSNQHLAHYFTIPTSDTSAAPDALYSSNYAGYSGDLYLVQPPSDFYMKDIAEGVHKYVGALAGLSVIDSNNTAPSKGMVNYITSTYNTGWMNGDIKLATLSDTDATNVTGTELHPNGNFDFSSSDVSYITNSASGTATVVAGQLQLSGGTSGYADHFITINTVAGKTYTITVDYVIDAGSYNWGFYVNSTYIADSSGALYASRATGSYSFTFTANSSSESIDLVCGGATSTIHGFDNLSIRLAESDRSVNGNGLQVFGTITKTPVATGADLVAYSGFSASNYLQQPYNADLDFGTGDFCIMGWVKPTTAVGEIVLDRSPPSNTGTAFRINLTGGVIPTFITSTNGGTNTSLALDTLPLASWAFITFVRSSGVLYGYINGEGSVSLADTVNLTNTSASLYLGYSPRYAAGTTASLALWRISATAPTAEQIAKIYEDEKALFQEGAQATLYGASDAVTALAYDEDEQILRVGTSSGRSDFSGLRRVSNTTTGVTTAISSSNGMVVEQ